jgi:hypothetical protein
LKKTADIVFNTSVSGYEDDGLMMACGSGFFSSFSFLPSRFSEEQLNRLKKLISKTGHNRWQIE